MPGHMVHAYLDRMCFGKAYWKVHRRLDSAWFVCRRYHRRFWHDRVSATTIATAAYPGDQNAVWSAWLHIWADEHCSANPLFQKKLELLARADAGLGFSVAYLRRRLPCAPRAFRTAHRAALSEHQSAGCASTIFRANVCEGRSGCFSHHSFASAADRPFAFLCLERGIIPP